MKIKISLLSLFCLVNVVFSQTKSNVKIIDSMEVKIDEYDRLIRFFIKEVKELNDDFTTTKKYRLCYEITYRLNSKKDEMRVLMKDEHHKIDTLKYLDPLVKVVRNGRLYFIGDFKKNSYSIYKMKD